MILFFGFFGLPAFNQENTPADSLRQMRSAQPGLTEGGDSVKIADEKFSILKEDPEFMEHSPKKAMYYSLVLPGLGQAYNKKYWKIPIVYGALGGVSYWIYYNTQEYRQSSENYSIDQSDTNERYLRFWRRNLELSYITLVATHPLQVLDAYVDANLFYWDVSPDLSIRIEPSIDPIYLPTEMPVANYGFRCKMTF